MSLGSEEPEPVPVEVLHPDPDRAIRCLRLSTFYAPAARNACVSGGEGLINWVVTGRSRSAARLLFKSENAK